MLLFPFDRMCRTATIYIILTFFIVTSVFAEIIITNTKQDLILRANKNKGDLLINPPKVEQEKSKNIDSKKKYIKTGENDKQNLKVTKEIDDLPKPDKNYIDVYIGRCPFTIDALKEVKKFSSDHKDYYIQYYGMKTNSNYELNPAEIKDLEIYLPVDADKYDIKSVPTFVFNVGGSVYKVAGSATLNDVYNEIVSGKVGGEKKDGYTDLGVRGKECKALLVNLTPQSLKESDKQIIAKEINSKQSMASMVGIKKVFLPEKSEPEVINKKGYANYSGIKKFIVFSESQKDWAKEMIKRKGAVGCCTDCAELKDIGNLIQLCTKELVDSLNVKSVPTVINID